MSTTAFGPQGPNYTTTRPAADPKASAGIDTWFKNCSAAGAKDGTFATADYFNVTLGNLRYLVRTANVGLDDADDTMVYRAVQAMVAAQSGSKLTANVDYYVDATLGNDGNTGLSAGAGHAFATIQRAVNVVQTFNLNGYTVTIHVADAVGTYAPITCPLINGSGAILIQGNVVTPANTEIHAAIGPAVTCGVTGYFLNGFKVSSSAADSAGLRPGAGVWATPGGTISVSNIEFGACADAHMYATGGSISFSQNIKITGGGASHMTADAGGYIYYTGNPLPALNIPGAVTLTNFAVSKANSILVIVYGSIVGAANVTGVRYSATLNGVINTGGGGASYLPGSSAGSTATGGQYS